MSDSIDITSDELAEALVKNLMYYNDGVKEKLYKHIDNIAEEALKEIKEKSPVYKGKSKKLEKGAYKKGWKSETKHSLATYTATIYNKNYNIVHLLELGHLLRDGTGRVYGEVDAQKHVEPVNADAERKVDELIKEIENGTF